MSEYNQDYDADEVINDFKAKFKWPKSDEVDEMVAPAKVPLKLLLSFLITVLGGAVVYYFMLPPFNFKSLDMYLYLLVLLVLFWGSFTLLCRTKTHPEYKPYIQKKSRYPLIIAAVVAVAIGIGALTGVTLFRAKDYSELITVEQRNFQDDFKSISYMNAPRLDASTSYTLADQQLGSLADYKSQYVVTNDTNQINLNDRPVRVAYLSYASVFKWFNNTKDGIPAYMIIDVVSQNVQAVTLDEGIKYSPSELFNEKLIRHLRFQYPTYMMDTPRFEIDDDMSPYWITAVLDKTIGLFGGTDVKGAIITDAVTGESTYYPIGEVPTWVDKVYSDELLLQQYNYYGKLQNGFWNSLIFQNDVNVASDGNGYIALEDDVWFYTGVTSPQSDASNFGFVLINQRTKEVRYYENGGAMESGAMGSAQDALQNYNYQACFPILLSIDGYPTYFMSLKGSENTVKAYAFVNLEDKTIVGTCVLSDAASDDEAVETAVRNYLAAMEAKGKEISHPNQTDGTPQEDTTAIDPNGQVNQPTGGTVTGKITDIRTAVIDGNSRYYIAVDGVYYYINAADEAGVVLLNTGDTVTVTFDENASGSMIAANSVNKA